MNKTLLLWYPRCLTCKKARTWLDERGIQYDTRDMVADNPSAIELKKWHQISGLPLKRFFNSSGNKYKELSLKDKLPGMTEEEQYKLLGTDGMLVKRPLLVTPEGVAVGFKENEWEKVTAGSNAASPKAKSTPQVTYPAFVLKITLKGMKPSVWRRVIVPANMRFDTFNEVLLRVMDWDGAHLSSFYFSQEGVEIMANPFAEFDEDDFEGALRAEKVKLSEFVPRCKKFLYTYDMGDSWEHTVVVEKYVEDYAHNYPMVIAYQGTCPPDDTGGVWDYLDMLESEDEDMQEWLQENARSEYDMEETNKGLKRFRVRK